MNTTPPSPRSIITSGSEKESEGSPRLTHSFSNRSLISRPRAQLSIGEHHKRSVGVLVNVCLVEITPARFSASDKRHERNKCVKTSDVTASSEMRKWNRT